MELIVVGVLLMILILGRVTTRRPRRVIDRWFTIQDSSSTDSSSTNPSSAHHPDHGHRGSDVSSHHGGHGGSDFGGGHGGGDVGGHSSGHH